MIFKQKRTGVISKQVGRIWFLKQQPGVIPFIGTLLCVFLAWGSGFQVFLAAAVSPFSTETGPVDLKFERVITDNGLSQGSVFSILQDQQGYLWFGTQSGLNRYDGYSFKIYNSQPFDETTLLYDFVTNLFQQENGVFWVNTQGQLNRFEPESDSFKQFPSGRAGMPRFRVAGLVEDGRQGLWAYGTQGGLAIYDPETESFEDRTHLTASVGLSGGIGLMKCDGSNNLWGLLYSGSLFKLSADGEIRGYHYPDAVEPQTPLLQLGLPFDSFYFDVGGEIWVGNGRLARFNLQDEQFHFFQVDPNDPNSLGHPRARTITPDHRGHLWVLGPAGIISRWEPENNKFSVFRPNEKGTGPSPQTTGLFIDSKGLIWLFSNTDGVARFLPDSEEFLFSNFEPGNSKSLPDTNITQIFEDYSGTLWFSTRARGLASFSRSRQKFEHHLDKPGRDTGYENNFVWSLMVDEGKQTWIGTNRDGLLVFDEHRQKLLARYIGGPDPRRNLPANQVSALFEDGQGIWVGTTGPRSSLSRLDPKSGSIRTVDPKRIPNISHVRRSQKDGLLYFSSNSTGLFVLNEKTWETWPLYSSTFFLLHYVRSFTEDPEGYFWAATLGGLLQIDRDQGIVRQYRNDPENSRSLNGDDLLAVLFDDQGQLWTGGLGSGLNRLKNDGTFQKYTTRDGLADNTIYSILADKKGCLWMSTNRGIARFDPLAGQFTTYGTRDGLQNLEFNSNSSFSTSDGELLFGGVNGYNSFFPDRLNTNPIPPKIVLNVTGGKGLRQERVGQGRQVVSPPANRLVEFQFTPIDFAQPAGNKVSWRLEGFDVNWTPPGQLRRATYTNLEPGTYHFQVKGSNNDGVWSEITHLPLIVEPAFYQQIWFRLLAFFSIILLIVFFLIRQRSALLLKQEEAIRHRDLDRKSEELEYARQIQLAMLPEKQFTSHKIEITGHMITATEVGGDYYDFFRNEDGRICIAYGDATGHGMAAGMVVGMVKMVATFWNQLPAIEPVQMMHTLNNSLKKSLPIRSMGMGFGIATLDPVTLSLEICSSGMPFPLHFSRHNQAITPLELRGPPLGFISNISIPSAKLQLASGDMVIFLSDGFSERFDEEDRIWGNKALVEALNSLCPQAHNGWDLTLRFVAACDGFARTRRNEDDMTIVVLHVRE